jgi:hypothetical protein
MGVPLSCAELITGKPFSAAPTMPFPSRTLRLTVLAQNKAGITDFRPYVPSINDAGVVAFQATLEDGHTAVLTHDGSGVTTVATTVSANSPVQCFSSHPDINSAGQICIYAHMTRGHDAVVMLEPDGRLLHTPVDGPLTGIGPLGPTMNESGGVAFRFTSAQGLASIGVWQDGHWRSTAQIGTQAGHQTSTPTANTSGVVTRPSQPIGGDARPDASNAAASSVRFSAFDGLPVVNAAGDVAFRADRSDGLQGVFLARGGQTPVPVITTGSEISALARFTILNDRGQIAFAATMADGEPVLFFGDARGGSGTAGITPLLGGHRSSRGNSGRSGDGGDGGDGGDCDDSDGGDGGGFESFRGILINNQGPVVFYGTPHGGQLGIYTGPDPRRDRLLGLGDPLLGGTVSDFALNPVSVNEAGQITVRVALEDGRQFILRGDPER